MPGVCAECQADPPPYSNTIAPFNYLSPIRELILQLKFSSKINLALVLGQLLAESVATGGSPLPEMIIPVPLHPSRLRVRGYNQAQEIASAVARRLGIAVEKRTCKRQRDTPAQSAQEDADSRKRNLRGAFVVDSGFQAHHVAILDDVVTTGATVTSLAGSLRRAGVERVQVWCCCRAQSYR